MSPTVHHIYCVIEIAIVQTLGNRLGATRNYNLYVISLPKPHEQTDDIQFGTFSAERCFLNIKVHNISFEL